MKRLLCGALALAAAFGGATCARPSRPRSPGIHGSSRRSRWLAAGSRRSAPTRASRGSRRPSSHKDETLWSGGFGVADAESARPADAQTLYSICSISKLFTSIAILQLRDEDKLRLDDPVGKRLPWFRLKTAQGEGDVTIEGLLTHSSGLPQEPAYRLLVGARFRDADARGDHREERKHRSALRAREAPPVFEPRLRAPRRDRGVRIGRALRGLRRPQHPRPARRSRARRRFIPEAERGKRFATGYSSLDREGRRPPIPFFTMKGVDAAAGYASDANDLARFASWQLRLLAKRRQGRSEGHDPRRDAAHPLGRARFQDALGPRVSVSGKTTTVFLPGPRGKLPGLPKCGPRRALAEAWPRSSWRTPRAWTRPSGRCAFTTSWRPRSSRP